MRKLLAALLLVVMLVTALPLYLIPVSAADDFIRKDYTSVAKIEDPKNSYAATANGKTTGKLVAKLNTGASIVDDKGTPISKVTIQANITSNKQQSSALNFADGETLASNVDYVTLRYRYNYTNSSRCLVGANMTVLIKWSDGSKDYCVSANNIVSGEWAYLNFNFSNMADKAEGVYIDTVLLYFYNRTTNPSTNSTSKSTTESYLVNWTNNSSSTIKVSSGDVIEIGAFYYSNTGYYEGVKYDVAAVADGVTVDTAKIEDGTAYTLPAAPSKYGYDFVGWSDGTNTYAAGAPVAITKETTFTAVYEIQEGMSVFNVTVVSDGATLSTEPVVTGAQFLLPDATAKDEYNFVAWSDGVNTYAPGEKVTINADTTFTAVFVAKVYYDVTVESEGVTVDTAKVEENKKYTLPAATSKDGYNFIGWSDGETTYPAGAEITVTGNTAFSAVFAAKVFCQVTVVSEGETVAVEMIEVGTSYTLPAATTKPEHKFAFWTDGLEYYKAGAKVTIIGATTFEAVFSPLGDGKVIYENSFTDKDDLNEATQKGAGVDINYGRIEFQGTNASWWRKNVYLDNSTGDLTITFKLYPNLSSSHNIIYVNGKALLSSFLAMDTESWPYSTWMERGFRFGPSSKARGELELHECYAGYNTLDNEAIVTINIDTETGDSVVNVEYDCGENGKYSFTSDTLNVGPLTESMELTLGMLSGGSYMRMDDLVVKQADGQPFASNDIIERETFAFFSDNFDSSVKGENTLITYLNNNKGTKKTLDDGNVVVTGGVQTVVAYAGKFPASTAMISFDFMIPKFPEAPADNAQITVLTDGFSKQNHVCVKYNASLGKWIAGSTDNELAMSNYATIEEGVWNHAVVMFGKGVYINGEYAGTTPSADKMSRENGGSFFKMTGKSYGDKLTNAATYYVDNLYLANQYFDNDIVKITGYQKSDVVDGTYNVRFVCALPTLFEKQTKVGFDISSPSQGKSWNFETTKVYNSLSANYGTETITAKSLDAQALVAVAVKGIPEELENIDLDIKPYVVINGKKIYGTKVSMNPAGSKVEYDGICDINVVDPEQTPITVDPNGALAGKKVVLLLGQSNMAGRGDETTVEKVDDDRLWMYRDGEFIKLKEPVHTDDSDAGTSPGVAFAKAYAETYNEEVVVLPMAVGGTGLTYWAPGNAPFEGIIDAARLAMEQGGEVIAVLWHQGETDAGNKSNKVRYAFRYVEFIQQLYNDLGFDYETVPFIVGRHFPNHPDARSSDPETNLYIFPNAIGIDDYFEVVTYPRASSPMRGKGVDPDMIVGKEDIPTLYALVDASNLRSIDNTHLDAPSTRVFGYRYFNVYQDLVKGDVDGDGNIDYYDFADPLDLPEDQRTIPNIAAILDSYLINK